MRDKIDKLALINAARHVWENKSCGESFEEFLIDVAFAAHQPVIRMSVNTYPDDVGDESFQKDCFIRSWTDKAKGYAPYLSWGFNTRHMEVMWEYRMAVGRDNWFIDERSES